MAQAKIPFEESRAIYDEVVATGSQRAVAKAHGLSQSSVKRRVLAHMAAMRIEGPEPGIISPSHAVRGSLSASGQGGAGKLRQAREQLRSATADLERVVVENRRLRERIHDLEERVDRWDRLEAKLDALLARPTVIGTVTHRRVRDGGVGGREEARQLRRSA